MAATIKQTTHEPDQGAAEDMIKPAALQPPLEVSFAEKAPFREEDDNDDMEAGAEDRAVSGRNSQKLDLQLSFIVNSGVS